MMSRPLSPPYESLPNVRICFSFRRMPIFLAGRKTFLEETLIPEEQPSPDVGHAVFFEADGEAVHAGKHFLHDALDRTVLAAGLVPFDKKGVLGKTASVEE